MKKEYRGLKSFSRLFDDVTKLSFSKHGFANHKIAAYWPMILGKTLAQFTVPQKIVFKPGQSRDGVLYIGVSNPGLSLEIQSCEAKIVEKISQFFGYQAVSRIRVNIDRGAAKSDTKKAPQDVREVISNDDFKSFEQDLENIKDEELKNTLTSLMKSLYKAD